MKKTLITLILFLTPLTLNCLANDKTPIVEKTVSPNVQKEIHDFDVKRREINAECKLKRKAIQDKLSFEAQKVLHERRMKRLPSTTEVKKS